MERLYFHFSITCIQNKNNKNNNNKFQKIKKITIKINKKVRPRKGWERNPEYKSINNLAHNILLILPASKKVNFG